MAAVCPAAVATLPGVLLLVNGPNLAQLGTRDPAVYGSATLADIVAAVRSEAAGHDVEDFQADAEPDLLRRLHAARDDGTSAVVINPGALSHYSYALRDALAMLAVPKVEVHLSQTAAREQFRHHSVVSAVVDVTITGAGLLGYRLAVRAALHLRGER